MAGNQKENVIEYYQSDSRDTTIMIANAKKSANCPNPGTLIGTFSRKNLLITLPDIESTYVVMPFVTLAAPIEYSKIKFHPIRNAMNSPIVTKQ